MKKAFIIIISIIFLVIAGKNSVFKKVLAVTTTLVTNASGFTTSGSITNAQFIDNDNTSYLLDPAATGNSLIMAGNVGIGTTAPIGLLNVSGEALGKALVTLNEAGATPSLLVASTSGNLKVQLTNGGRLGIATNSAQTTLHIKSASPLRLSYDASNYIDLAVGSAGDLTITGATTGGCASQCPTITFNTDLKGFQIYSATLAYLDLYENPGNKWRMQINAGDFEIYDTTASQLRWEILDAGVHNIYDSNDLQANIPNDAAANNDDGWATGAVDYAEFMEKLDYKEDIQIYEVVGIKKGKITKNTEDATAYMVTSTDAGIRGGNPLCETYNCSHDRDPNWLAVAYIGQMPILVDGSVSEGDFIIPSNRNDGRAIAVSKEMITPEQYDQYLGVALEGSVAPSYEQKTYDPNSDYEQDREMYKMLRRKGNGHIINTAVSVSYGLPDFANKPAN